MLQRPFSRDVFGAFTFYFAAQFLLVPIIAQILHRAMTGEWKGIVEWVGGATVRPWLTLMTVLIMFIAMAVYAFSIEKGALKGIWGKYHLPFTLPFKAFGYWCLAYPCVLIVNGLVHVIISKWVAVPVVDQIAVQQVKSSLSDPLLYLLTSISIVTMVPFVEEVLFRGFLQQYLKNYFSVFASVAIAAGVFALFHFSLEQGWMNVELIAALFTFSLFLGWIRERYQSLNASIILHAIFNGMSLLFLSFQEQIG